MGVSWSGRKRGSYLGRIVEGNLSEEQIKFLDESLPGAKDLFETTDLTRLLPTVSKKGTGIVFR